jgi:hypothetical protein
VATTVPSPLPHTPIPATKRGLWGKNQRKPLYPWTKDWGQVKTIERRVCCASKFSEGAILDGW